MTPPPEPPRRDADRPAVRLLDRAERAEAACAVRDRAIIETLGLLNRLQPAAGALASRVAKQVASLQRLLGPDSPARAMLLELSALRVRAAGMTCPRCGRPAPESAGPCELCTLLDRLADLIGVSPPPP